MDDLARQLAEVEERFRLAFDRAPTGMALVAPDGRFLRVNVALCQLLGISEPTLLALTFQDLTHPDDLAIDLELVRRVLAGEIETYTLEKRFSHGEGRWVTAQIDVSMVRDDDGTPRYFVSQVQDVTERRASEVGLSLADRTQRATLDALEQGIVFTDLTGGVQLQNRAAEEILGYDAGGLTTIFRSGPWVGYDEAEEVRRHGDRELTRTTRTGKPVSEARVTWRRPDGSVVALRLSTEPIFDGAGELTGVVSAFTDVTEQEEADRARLQAEEALRVSQARFEALVERSTDVIAVVDADGLISYSSPAGERILGHRPGTFYGESFLDLAHPDDRDGIASAFAELLDDPGGTRLREVRIRTAEGGWRHVEVVATNRLADPAVLGIVANVRDVTERAEAVARLAWQAYHDPLTGLPNRLLLMDRLEHAVLRARNSAERTALLFVDLDRFKLVNDTLGHEAGDQVLVEVGRRIVDAVGAGDTVSRHGGDEFMVVAEVALGPREVLTTAEAIRAAVERPVAVGGSVVNVSASIGIAFDAGQEPAALLRDADIALYRAKERGKNRIEIFNESLRDAALRRVEAEQLLRTAHEQNRLAVFHQPIVALSSGRLLGTEALLRVPDAVGVLQSPARFLAVADDSGLIVPIGLAVLHRSCATLAAWRAESPSAAPDHVAVNLSARQLGSRGFVDAVLGALDAHRLGPEHLVLEFTEDAIIDAERSTTRAIQQLHAAGVTLAIDDFGTGYSSLTYLKRFPIRWVKLDRSFVSGIGIDASDTAIVEAVVSLGRSLGLGVVAEGIESAQQLRALRDLGCEAGQGYLLGRPVAPDLVDRAARDLDGLATG